MWQMANLELHTRVPFLLRVPWMTDAMARKRSAAIVELVDIFPTLAELAGVDVAHGP
jgi:iduronate 2-sulfatase